MILQMKMYNYCKNNGLLFKTNSAIFRHFTYDFSVLHLYFIFNTTCTIIIKFTVFNVLKEGKNIVIQEGKNIRNSGLLNLYFTFYGTLNALSIWFYVTIPL